MSDASNQDQELRPYLESEKTGGHPAITEPQYWLLDNLILDLTPDRKLNPLDKELIEKRGLSDMEIALLQRLNIESFSSSGNGKDLSALSGDKLVETVDLLKNVLLSEEELGQVLGGKISLHDAFALHGLQPFEARLLQNKEAEEYYKGNEEAWQISNGDYGKDGGFSTRIVEAREDEELLWEQIRKIPENINVETLLGEELTLADIISQQLLLGNDQAEPMVILDIGGLAGLSWHRLANHFQKEIDEKKLIFVVTSLGADFDKAMSLVSGSYGLGDTKDNTVKSGKYQYNSSSENISDDDLNIVLKTKDLVHHIATDLPGLFRMKIEIDEKEIPIIGNVALANDNSAIALHSLVPSIQLPMVAALLNDHGVYKTDTRYTFHAPKREHHRARGAELFRSFLILANELGLQRVEMPEEGSSSELLNHPLIHIFLRKPRGPKIRAFLLPEQREVRLEK